MSEYRINKGDWVMMPSPNIHCTMSNFCQKYGFQFQLVLRVLHNGFSVAEDDKSLRWSRSYVGWIVALIPPIPLFIQEI